MPRRKLDKDVSKAIRDARSMVEVLAKADGNEAETRRRVERIFESLMGYDVFRHISRERAVRGAGETEHVDFAVQLESGEEAKPLIMVELKRVNLELAPKHLKQVSSYAIDAGCEWIILTNAREWRLYHVAFGKPPETKLLYSWDLMNDDPAVLADRFGLIGYKSVKKGALDDLWEKTSVLLPRNVLGALLSEDSIKLLRRLLRRSTGVLVSPEDVVGSIRRLLNEAAGGQMDAMKISLPEGRRRRARRKREEAAPKEAGKPPAQEPGDGEPQAPSVELSPQEPPGALTS